MQELELDTDPKRLFDYDYDRAEIDFTRINAEHFRAIYFALAPLLTIPLYHQIRPREAIYGREMPLHSSFWEHEAMAHYLGQKHFMHPACATDCVLKTEQQDSGDRSVITVHAYGHRSKKRVTYVSEYGGDGRFHDVPVYWDEYIPVTGSGSFMIKEDNSVETDSATSPSQRIEKIQRFLSDNSMSVYRRHITAKL